MRCSLKCSSAVYLFGLFQWSLKPVMDITLLIFTIYPGTLLLDVITIVITNEKIKMSTHEQECQCVSGSLDWKSCHLIHNPGSSPLNLAFCDTVKHTRPSYY